MAIIYGELHKLAKSHLRRAQFAGTLQPTVIVHEAYLRLVGREPIRKAAPISSESPRGG